MRKTNYHMHTERCQHAYGKDEEFVLQSLRQGYKEIGFSDHACWNYDSDFIPHIRMPFFQFRDYKESVLSLRNKYKGSINILFGMEAEYFEKYMDWMLDFCIEENIDYLILGNHFWESDEKGVYYGYCKPKYVKEYFNSMEKAIRTGMYAYVAHPELIMRNPYLKWNDKIEEGFTRICMAAKEMDMPVELNCAGLQHNIRTGTETYPYSKFWELAAKIGCKAIIGLDAHSLQDLDSKWYDLAVNYLNRCDIEIVDSIKKIDYENLKKSQNIR